MSIFGTLNIARQGMFANQTAMSVISNNIANVNTPGYSRQRVVIESIESGGARVSGIERLRDEFLPATMRESNARLGRRDALALNLAQLETVLGQSGQSGLSVSLQDYFDAMQALSAQPGGTSEREAVRYRGEQLASAFASLSGQVTSLRNQIDTQIAQEVQRINELTEQIAKLNGQLLNINIDQSNVQAGQNEQLDRRDRLIDELSDLVPVRTVVDSKNNTMSVFIGSRILVEGGFAQQMGTRVNEANGGLLDVGILAAGSLLPLGADVTEGRLAALLEVRDGYARDAHNEIDRLAATLVREINSIHSGGMGLDSVGGRDFFVGQRVTAHPAPTNRGGVLPTTAQVLDPGALDFHDYEVRFTSANQFDLVDTTTGSTLSTGNAYVPGMTVGVAGMLVSLDDVSGPPVAGDKISFNAYEGTATNIDVSDAIKSDLRAIAAGQTDSPGDNRNALAMADVANATLMGVPASTTLSRHLDHVRLTVASATESTQREAMEETTINQQIQGLIDGKSGVSLDEEASNIIQFQRAYEASSRVVSATNEMLQSVLSMI